MSANYPDDDAYLITPKIYFIRCGEYIKIGKANIVFKRIKDLRTGNPYELELVGAVYGKNDADFHDLFWAYHHKYEWFKADKFIIDWLMQPVQLNQTRHIIDMETRLTDAKRQRYLCSLANFTRKLPK